MKSKRNRSFFYRSRSQTASLTSSQKINFLSSLFFFVLCYQHICSSTKTVTRDWSQRISRVPFFITLHLIRHPDWWRFLWLLLFFFSNGRFAVSLRSLKIDQINQCREIVMEIVTRWSTIWNPYKSKDLKKLLWHRAILPPSSILSVAL